MPNIDSPNWGPSQMLFVPDQTLSQEQVSVGFGLDNTVINGILPANQSHTVSTFMRKLLIILGMQPALKNVVLTQDYPQTIEEAPRVVWSLEGRESGIEGRNRKGPYMSETWPTDNGCILEKWVQPQSFQISFECFGTTPDECERIKDFIEMFIVRNPYSWASSGARQFFFNSEGSHSRTVLGGAAQPLDKRTLHYWGAMDAIYINQVDRIGTIEVLNTTSNASVLTVPIVRGLDGSMADIFPIPGPLVLLFLHDRVDRMSLDYLPNTDYTFVIDREKLGLRFYLNWINQGRNPLPGSTYYATYLHTLGGETVVTDQYERNSDPEPGSDVRTRRRGLIQGRAAIAPRILGQEVDATDPTRGQPIIFSRDDVRLETPSLSPNVLDALSRAQIQVAAVLDPSRIPGLVPGSAFSPPGTS